MKNRKKLSFRNRIFLCFIICCFVVVVFDKNLDELYWGVIEPDAVEYTKFTWQRAIYFLISLTFFILGALVFYKMTARIIREESENRIKEQNLLYAAIAHDLKTPMTSVKGFAKALSDNKIPTAEQNEIFDIIYRKSNDMDDMINTLFEYAKLGTSGYKPVISPMDICGLVREIIAENYADFENHNISLDIDIPDTDVIMEGDRKELKRAISNLIVNIYKHNRDGIAAKITVLQTQDNNIIKIADNGEALPANMNIFEPFVTENTSRTIGHGTGLGLAITRRIITRHGGKIYVDSNIEGWAKAFVIEMKK